MEWEEMLDGVEADAAQPDGGHVMGRCAAGERLLRCYVAGLVPAGYVVKCRRVLVGLGLVG